MVLRKRSSMLGCESSGEVGLLSGRDGQVGLEQVVGWVAGLVLVLEVESPRGMINDMSFVRVREYSPSDPAVVCELHQSSVAHCLLPTQA